MKKFKFIMLVILMLALGITLAACGEGNAGGTQTPEPPLSGESKVLVVYFSWSASHNTQTMANYIAEEADAELFRLIPETPYTDNYNEVIDIAQREQNSQARPKIAEDLTQEQLDGYDVIFVGYPIWWYDAPMIIYTFLEAHDFSGKTIIPFATSGGSGISEEAKFRDITGATVLDGLCIRNIGSSSARGEIQEWISNLGL